MNYIIDAYNLIGKLQSISLSDPNKEEKLIAKINQLEKNKNDFFIIIFDGKNKNNPYQSIQKENQIKVIFTDILESADEYIIRILKTITNKSNYIIVTSDNEIKYKSKKNKIKTINSESFFRYLSQEKKYTNQNEMTPKKPEIDFWLKEFNKKIK
tara:strand:- start:6204 stop:6668 length:465 start_codon:yes stop_codon:yes gene_type:complete